ncbi:putative transcription factor/ chromatin remodeling BED-type(Zn) family [Medicago truncatula]|uniref:Putative transcription factor/ chromatin remodeling BED-type(Zn) family n=1 Tax=Medicago truncatula TaxID=3880 RepID=A0A396JIH3_MEDTR|nr:zinc finger BED domain-containing protein DAYSLEEPER-like [Medicago truncatula]RHN76541.1 putative transcription factor/ chromatin remodeling BED-type(Zn) family [Medicago truncatula]
MQQPESSSSLVPLPTTPQPKDYTCFNAMELPNSEIQPHKHVKRKSSVWEHFTVENTDEPGCVRARCKGCQKLFAYINGSKQSGTSHLRRHVLICSKNPQAKHSKTGVDPHKKRARAKSSKTGVDQHKRQDRVKPYFTSISYSQERCNDKIAKMIILHDYPLHIVEHKGFNDFARALQPQFNPLSLNTVQGDCIAIYLREKQNLLNLVDRIPGRVNLTLDLWTSNQTTGYVFLRGHFIDGDWNFHHPILNVFAVPYPDLDGSLNQTIVTCLKSWHLKGRLFCVLFDKLFSNETLMGNVRDLLSLKNPVILNGQLLRQSCYARVLSCLALDTLWAMQETIAKVRKSVQYVKSSKLVEERFLELKQVLQVPSKMDLLIDDNNKWDTVYSMLVAACELKEVFTCFDAYDSYYTMSLTMDDWKQIENLCACLKFLYDAAKFLTIQPYSTANLFFLEVSKLKMQLTEASQDPFCCSLITSLQEKFDQYWRESCFILAIAVAMDPRYKMNLVESTFAKIFGENAEQLIRAVEDGLQELFLEYSIMQVLPFTETNFDVGCETMMKTEAFQEVSLDESFFPPEDGISDIQFYISDFTTNQQYKSELNVYLEEPLESSAQEFDILSWWRINGLKYPTLSRMASDILSMPVSTLSADSIFDTEIRKMDNYRSLLDSVTLEALICTKDWFHCGSTPIDVSCALVKMEY